MVIEFIELIEKNAKQNMVVAEIGVRNGSTTIPASLIVKKFNGIYIAVDWFRGSISEGNYNEFSDDEIIFRTSINNNNCSDVVKIIAKSSEEASYEIDDNSLDICFIDADHSYLSVKNDILKYLPKVKNGGILCGHDFEPYAISFYDTFTEEELKNDMNERCNCHCGVVQAIGEIFGFENITIHDGMIWSIIK